MSGAAVGKIVSIDTGEDDITQSPTGDGLCRIFRFVYVKWWRCARCLDGTKSASSCTLIAHELRVRKVDR
jgi:hypothetical protein